jgi:hypothetical protein
MSFPWKEDDVDALIPDLSYMKPKRTYTPRKPKITESQVNAFMKWILTVDVTDYPKYKAVINQYQKYGRNARFQVLDLFRLWLEK